MSHEIFKNKNTAATRFVGPDRGGGDRTMLQINDLESGKYVQVSPATLQGILTALAEDGLPDHKAAPYEGNPVKCRLVASCDLHDGRLEARLLSQGDIVFVLVVERADKSGEDETEVRSDVAHALIQLQWFDREETCR